MEKHFLVIGLIFLLLFSSVFPISMGNDINTSEIIKQSYNRGNTLYVGGAGPNNYSKIQDAINDALDGDTVFVFDELAPYHEYIVINKSINVLGEEKTTTIINGSGEIKEVVSITADHVTISGFTITNYGKEAILVRANYTNITHNILGSYIYGWSGYGIRLFYANHSLIEDNEISWVFDSINVHYSHNNTIRKNHLSSSNINGIWFAEATHNEISGNVIDTGLLVDMPGSYIGIRLTSSDNNTLMNNTMTSHDEECMNGMMLWDSQNNIVTGNAFTSCGLEWYGSYENIVDDNTVNNKPLFYLIGQPHTVIDNAGQVILIQCYDSTIQNVKISNTPNAIELIESNDCHITNCTCVNNTYGIYTESSTNNQITENVVINNKHGIYIETGSSYTSIIDNSVQESLYIGIYSNAAYTSIERNRVFDNSLGIMIGSIFALKNSITANNVTNNWAGIVLSSISTTVTKNIIKENRNGVQINGGSNRNQIILNDFSQNEYGINITYESQARISFCNLIQKNNFIGNIRHSYFDSSLFNHFIGNYWEGDSTPPYRIDGVLSFYKVDPWTGGIIWEKHIPWMCFDWSPAKEPYDIGV